MLDASLRVNVLNVLKDLREELGITVLFITHDIGQACYLADRVLVMEHGVMVEQGTTDEVIFNPQHEYTRRLLADVEVERLAEPVPVLHRRVAPRTAVRGGGHAGERAQPHGAVGEPRDVGAPLRDGAEPRASPRRA